MARHERSSAHALDLLTRSRVTRQTAALTRTINGPAGRAVSLNGTIPSSDETIPIPIEPRAYCLTLVRGQYCSRPNRHELRGQQCTDHLDTQRHDDRDQEQMQGYLAPRARRPPAAHRGRSP